ncbi:hypothetical protein E2C01_056360 [Portunus trituberculatus]|uniref:Uncharacterized protein n=1 Tax=Portunus trituberculatus TaxID=210409 RepID=A0A5B7GZE8_PORTR|nr:hypothetical protein [Portunus trituberculatus]
MLHVQEASHGVPTSINVCLTTPSPPDLENDVFHLHKQSPPSRTAAQQSPPLPTPPVDHE